MLKSKIFRTRGVHAYHYTIDVVIATVTSLLIIVISTSIVDISLFIAQWYMEATLTFSICVSYIR